MRDLVYLTNIKLFERNWYTCILIFLFFRNEKLRNEKKEKRMRTEIVEGILITQQNKRNNIYNTNVFVWVVGPINNLVDNAQDITRSMTCAAELSANQSATKWKFRLKPLENVMKDMRVIWTKWLKLLYLIFGIECMPFLQ